MNETDIIKEFKTLWGEYHLNSKSEIENTQFFLNLIDDIRRKEEDRSSQHLQPWLRIYEESISWLSDIWLILNQKYLDDGKNNPLLQSIYSLISASCNHAVSVRLLVISGLDNPARGAVRALDEHLCTCLVILNEPKLAKGFQSSQSNEEASQFWQENFSTRKLHKHLNALEKSLDIKTHVSNDLREWRKDAVKSFSQTIHPSYMGGIMASHAADVTNTDLMANASVFGKLSASSERTLKYACKNICYFSAVGSFLLFNEHNGKSPIIALDKKNEMHQLIIAGRDILVKINSKYWTYTNYNI